MFFSKFYFFFVFFVLYWVNASAFSCQSNDPATCRTEVGEFLEKELLDRYTVLATTTQAKIADIFTATANDLPPNDPHTEVLLDSVKKIRKDIEQVPTLATMKDSMKLGDIKFRFIAHVDPDFSRADKEDSTNNEVLRTSLVKNGDSKKLLNQAILDMMTATQKAWTDVYTGLRDSDRQTNPVFNQINAINEKMTNEKNIQNKLKLGILLMESMANFNGTPRIAGLVRALNKYCRSNNVCDVFPETFTQTRITELGNTLA